MRIPAITPIAIAICSGMFIEAALTVIPSPLTDTVGSEVSINITVAYGKKKRTYGEIFLSHCGYMQSIL
jgi:hypothetical protein